MKREELRKILRGKCVTDEACESAIDELLNLHIVIPRSFYVMNPKGEDWEQLSIAFNTKEDAEKFKESDYHKREDPYAVIMCSI